MPNTHGHKHTHFMDKLRDFGIGLNLNQIFDLVNDKSQLDKSHTEQPTIVGISSLPIHEVSHENEIAHHSASHKHKEGVFLKRHRSISDLTPRIQMRFGRNFTLLGSN